MKCSSCGEGKLDVVETRVADGFTFVNRRRLACPLCGAKKTTFEIPAEVFRHSWFRTRTVEHERGVFQRLSLMTRNKEILERVRKGEKHLSIALDYRLAPNTVTHIANKAGVYWRKGKKSAPGGAEA